MNCTNVDNPRDSYNYTSEYIENNDIVEFQNVGTAISNIDLSLVSIPDNNLVGVTVHPPPVRCSGVVRPGVRPFERRVGGLRFGANRILRLACLPDSPLT